MSAPRRDVTGGSTAVIGCDCCGADIDFAVCSGIWQIEIPAGTRFLCDDCGLFWLDYPDGEIWEPI